MTAKFEGPFVHHKCNLSRLMRCKTINGLALYLHYIRSQLFSVVDLAFGSRGT